MSRNLMSTRNRNRVIEVARETVAAQLAEAANAALLDRLPAGASEKVRRPSGPPSEWLDLIDLPAASADG